MKFCSTLITALAALVCVSNVFAAPYSWYPRATVVSGNTVKLTWEDEGGYPADYWQIYRDGNLFATSNTNSYTDTSLSPGENHTYYIESVSSQTYTIPSRQMTVTTKMPGNPFILEGVLDFSSYVWMYPSGCDCSNLPSLPLYAAIRGTTLYVATASPGGPNQSATDRFLLISDVLDPSLTTPGPWAKGGVIAVPPGKPFIGAESTNNYVAWFNAPASAQVIRSVNTNGVIEGTIDLVETFGYMPAHLYFAVLAYNTGDGGQLVWQSPNPDAAVNQVIAEDEFLEVDTAVLHDDDADGVPDVADPSKGLVLSIAHNPDDSVTLSFPRLPGYSYSITRAFTANGPYELPNLAATSDTTTYKSVVRDDYSYYYQTPALFYKMSIQDPL